MSVKRVAILLGGLVVVGVSVNLIVGLPILKTTGYRALVQQYVQAERLAPTGTDDGQLKWDVEVRASNDVRARLQARKFMDVVRLQFPDDTAPRSLYDYEDYSSPIAIRVARDRLFVHWGESLFHTDHWVLVYDVRRRREIERRRVDPKDMPTEQ